ncbi:DUF3231 family protein [Paenisporosarcina antarctica]|uniref:DUF3231 family protein n=1 Tax=Paenisporosarcina antarctica TaxID=417367 RepID=A0A4P6ZXL5_9BACL|nr:DUF3231 family protein [Paenisporosarcina antarctica]QBP41014.1 DUF3231 family protein [Paenisporosarcina antarctica]
MEDNHNPKLASSEVGLLWEQYQNDTLGICTISYFLNIVEDPKISSILEYALELAENHVKVIRSILDAEQHPIPMGFTEQDVHVNAPRLFSDTFILTYMAKLGAIGLNSYSVALPNSIRNDIRDFYTSCLHSSAELVNRSTNLMLKKGVMVRPPYIPYPNQVEFVQKQHFLAGWIGEERQLTTIEITNLFFNLQRNVIGSSIVTGFSQVASSKNVRQYFVKGSEIAKHHSTVFAEFFSKDNLVIPMTSDTAPTLSTVAPFSDKLMMFLVTALNAVGTGYYGASLGASPRRDLGAAYTRLTAEIMEYAEDGANIMINNGWLEKPPSSPDRRNLAKG